MKKYDRAIFIIFSIFVFLMALNTSLLLVAKYLNPIVAQSEVADWKTYADEDLGFSIAYPAGMVPEKGNIAESEMVVFTENHADNHEDLIQVCPKDCGADYRVQEWIKNATPITIDGMPAKVYKEDAMAFVYFEETGSETFLPLNAQNPQKGGWILMYLWDTAKIDTIINSFKFVNSTETAEWKTYKNNEYGFEFSYASRDLCPGYGGSDAQGNVALVELCPSITTGTITVLVKNDTMDAGGLHHNYFGYLSNGKITGIGSTDSSRVAYQYSVNKGGCKAYIVATPMYDGKILEISLDNCGAGQVADSNFPENGIPFVGQLISTFKFTK